jgi:hypothetical protein
VVDLVTEDEEGDLGQVLHGEKGIELGLGLGEALVVLGVDEEDDTANFGEVVLPETAGYSQETYQRAGLVWAESIKKGGDGICVHEGGRSLTLLVTTQVKCREAVVTDSQFLRSRVGGWGEHGNAVVLSESGIVSHHAISHQSHSRSKQTPYDTSHSRIIGISNPEDPPGPPA